MKQALLGFFDHPGRWKAARSGRHVSPLHHKAASKIAKTPGMTRSKYKLTNGIN
jgi:hypothetical protein